MTVKELTDFLYGCPWDREVYVRTSKREKEIIDAITICTRSDDIIIETVEEEN